MTLLAGLVICSGKRRFLFVVSYCFLVFLLFSSKIVQNLKLDAPIAIKITKLPNVIVVNLETTLDREAQKHLI